MEREKCVSVIHAGPRGDMIPDKVVPGPGTYIKRLINDHKRTGSQAGHQSVGFNSHTSQDIGREVRGSILENHSTMCGFPGPNAYHS